MKVLANDGISKSGISILENAGFTVITNKVNQEDLINYINSEKIEVILVRSATQVREDIISSCPSLKIIGRGGVGMDNIDVEFARQNGLEVINTPAASSQSVAELVMGHLFSISRSIYDSNRNMPKAESGEFKSLKKKYAKGAELRGKTIGIIGFGRIGQFTAKYALGNGMKVIAFNPFIEKISISIEIANQNIEVPITMCSMDNLLSESDYISLHVPMPKDGNALLSTNEFNKMKNGVRIVNAARGGVIDEDALIEALKSGKVSDAALDVFVGEPNPRTDLISNEKIALTPHIGAATSEAQDRIGTELGNKIISFYKN
ncbi:MAG: 3-phosphoglycerate dehydrogenase [Crocinitomicaceae bacterium]|nr:3-phosphoglycerate dehydrogenase [Crocinitomicaceae bacterium]